MSLQSSEFLTLFLPRLGGGDGGRAAADAWRAHGLPVVFLALLSATGSELAMLEDAASAVAALRGVSLALGRSDGYDAATRTLTVALPGDDVARLGLEDATLALVPCFFAQGLDAKQSLANSKNAVQASISHLGRVVAPPRGAAPGAASGAGGDERCGLEPPPSGGDAAPPDARELQNALNRAAVDVLHAHAAKARGDKAAKKALKHVARAVDKETASVSGKTFEKHWLILVEAERAARTLDCALAVFCKSGKDRTGMAVTLAAAMVVGDHDRAAAPPPADSDGNAPAQANDDAEKLMLHRANTLREHGVRVRVCEKNTGRKKYAFNVIQREFLPFPYRPPMSTIEDLLSSTIHRDTS